MFFFGFLVVLFTFSLIKFSNRDNTPKEAPDIEWEKEAKEQVEAIEQVKGDSAENSFTETFPLTVPQYTNSETIIIPKINVNSPILHGQDSESLLKKGFWNFPASDEPGNGEVILLCHRRYFGQNTPKSCWDLNKLRNGDSIEIKLKEGGYTKYKVEDVSIVKGDDNSIYNISDKNRLKIISCSTADGGAGSNEYRIIITANPVSL